jgi:hypothetical protein
MAAAPNGWQDESSVCVRDLMVECRCPVHADYLGTSRLVEGTTLIWEYGTYLRLGDESRVQRTLTALLRQVPWVEGLVGKADLLAELVAGGLDLGQALAVQEKMLLLGESAIDAGNLTASWSR